MKTDLKHGLLFSRLDQKQLERIALHSTRLELGEDEILFEQDSPAEALYLVTHGMIKLFRLSAGGEEKIIEIVTPGQTFAEALMFLDIKRYPVSAAVLGHGGAEVIAVEAQEFAEMLRDSMDTCFMVMAVMSQRLRGLVREIDDLSLQSATCRVADYMLRCVPEGELSFHLDIPKYALASRLSVKPETLSRIIKSLSNQQILRVVGSQIEVLDQQGLANKAGVCNLPCKEQAEQRIEKENIVESEVRG
jgi:CRP-like cAMP-binding protein